MKKIGTSLIFISILLLSLIYVNDVVIRKSDNRYFMMKEAYEELEDKDFDIAVFGSCHAYRTVDPDIIWEEMHLYSYNFANPSEIMPATYLNMSDKFSDFRPKIALIETWGIHAYDTYISEALTLDGAFTLIVDSFPFSMEKMEVIQDFETLDILNETFALAKYKERFVEFDLMKEDYVYSYKKMKRKNIEGLEWLYEEMDARMEHAGYGSVDGVLSEDYMDEKIYVADDEMMPVEEDMLAYVDRIIALCRKENVIPIFFRAPYISNENELKKNNYLRDYLEERGVLYIDLEEEIDFDYQSEMGDLQHLNNAGAQKATRYLCGIMEEVLDEREEMVKPDVIDWRGWRPFMNVDIPVLHAVPQ